MITLPAPVTSQTPMLVVLQAAEAEVVGLLGEAMSGRQPLTISMANLENGPAWRTAPCQTV